MEASIEISHTAKTHTTGAAIDTSEDAGRTTSTFGTMSWLTGCHWSSPSHQNMDSEDTIPLFTIWSI